MSTTDPTSLTALLASHPEECAAVLAVLCVSGNEPATAQNICFYLRHQINAEPIYDLTLRILSAMLAVEIVTRTTRAGAPKEEFVLVTADRYAIALQGALPWLRARLSPPRTDRERELLSSARLFAIAAEVWATGSERQRNDVHWFVREALPGSAQRYRDAITDIVAMGGWRGDVETEVAAVWGRGTVDVSGAGTKGDGHG